jgi:glycyl-tRNA synthetase beta chain
MDLPGEVLTASMRTHQKYFACETSDGKVAPFFIVVGNNETGDGGAAMVAGNERVLRARLSDAQFFWDLDRKTTLESRVGKLDQRVFHAKLGSVYDKVERMRQLTEALLPHVSGADHTLARRAIRLSKADLSSNLVGEFPELQGIMGRYLALNDGERPDVAEAIAWHYAPAGLNGDTPSAPLDIVVALADKLETLIAFFAIDERPTGSKDPFALRRAALGIVRIILDCGLRLPLKEPIEVLLYSGMLDASLKPGVTKDTVTTALLEFFADRLKVALREQGVRHDLVSAVFALGHKEDDLVRLVTKVRALQEFLATDDGANLLIAYRRASKIVAIEEKRDGIEYRDAVARNRLEQPEERAMFQRLEIVSTYVACFAETGAAGQQPPSAEVFTHAMTELAKLRRPVDDFFDKVTVNVADPALRANRLRLLARIWTTLNRVADFSKIEG